MLKVRLMGGLGNQMFQYAFAKSYSLKNQKPAILDLSFLNDKVTRADVTPRNYELSVFPISLSSLPGHPQLQRHFLYRVYLKICKKIIPDFFIQESDLSFNENYLKRLQARLAVGYFQSEKYFKDIRTVLLKEFDFSKSVSQKNKDLATQMKSENSVSLHVRRGDYVTQAANKGVIGACGLDYYTQAIQYIEEHVQNPVFYVFSDDIVWARENLNFKSTAHFIDHNTGKNSFQDMYLMSSCKHNIIANSSFSWWGAWLNDFQKKITIAPQVWFLDPKMSSRDIYCPEWIKI